MISTLLILDKVPGVSDTPQLLRLRSEFTRRALHVHLAIGQHSFTSDGIVVVAGGTDVLPIIEKLSKLRSEGFNTIFALDSTTLDEQQMRQLADKLEQERFHFKLTAAIVYLLEAEQHFVYAFPKADIATTVAVVFQKSESILLVRRKHEPFKGMLSLPGGFLRPLIESLTTCAARELLEETGLSVNEHDLIPLSIRSNPNRDTRGHVIDQGYLVMLNERQEDYWRDKIRAADDASEIVLAPVRDVLSMDLAADHKLLAQEAMSQLINSKSGLLSDLRNWFHRNRLFRANGRASARAAS